jgi:hypothetical protein
MTQRIKSILALLVLLPLELAFGSYFETLPEGVRLLVYRRVHTNAVYSEFAETGKRQNLSFSQNLTAKDLAAVPGASVYLDEIKAISPEAYDIFTLGGYSIDAEAKVQVDGVGLAWGLTNRLTVYGSLPIYRAQVNMNIQRTQGNNYDQVADLLEASGEKSETTLIMEQLTRQLPDADGRLLQTVVTQEYGFEPLGNWTATGMGDAELGFIYRLTDWQRAGLATGMGVVLPTGRIANIDILQDFGFGDGQTDVFAEFGGGVLFFENRFGIDASTRYIHQFSSDKEYRIPTAPGMTLNTEKGVFKEKLGNIQEFRLLTYYTPTHWLKLIAGTDYITQSQSKYKSPYSAANNYLAMDTHQREHRVKAGFSINSINSYKRGRFPVPMALGLTGLKTVNGINVPEVTRFDLEFRLFF